MSSAGTEPVWYAWFKAAVFTLLAANATIFSIAGTLSEGIDSVAWLTLLALFELETAHRDRLRGKHATAIVRAVRLAAAAAVVVAAVRYVEEREWLDAANAWLWIAVVVLLEAGVRFPRALQRQSTAFRIATAMLYGALALLVPVWAARSEWFDAWDAALWLIAFVAIEVNLLSRMRRRAVPDGALADGASQSPRNRVK